MNSRDAHKIWIERCEAAEAIRGGFGLKAAFDYPGGEASFHYRAFAQELPRFVSEVRRMFTSEEIAAHLTRIERVLNEKNEDILDEDDPFRESPAAVAARARQFTTIKEFLTAATVGIS
jgi:hypothetical protein